MRFPVPTPDKFPLAYDWPEGSVQRVALGASWLDEVTPGWERQLDLSILDIDDACNCVCGQLFEARQYWSGYGEAAEVLSKAEPDAWGNWFTSHGFVIPCDTEAWLALVKQRFDSGTLSDS